MNTIKLTLFLGTLIFVSNAFALSINECIVPIAYDRLYTLKIKKDTTKEFNKLYTYTFLDANGTQIAEKYSSSIDFEIFKLTIIETFKSAEENAKATKNDLVPLDKLVDALYTKVILCIIQDSKTDLQPIAGTINPNKYIYVFKDLSENGFVCNNDSNTICHKQKRKNKCYVCSKKCQLDTVNRKNKYIYITEKDSIGKTKNNKLYEDNKIFNEDVRKYNLKSYENYIEFITDSIKQKIREQKSNFKNLKLLIKRDSIIIDSLLNNQIKAQESSLDEIIKSLNTINDSKEFTNNVNAIVNKLTEEESRFNSNFELFKKAYDSFKTSIDTNVSIKNQFYNTDSVFDKLQKLPDLKSIKNQIKSLKTQTLKNDLNELKNKLNNHKIEIIKKLKHVDSTIKTIFNIDNIDKVYEQFNDRISMLENSYNTYHDSSIRNIENKYYNNLRYYIGKIDRIEFQFQEGYIENIKAYITIPSQNNQQFIFENNYSIPFTTKANFSKLREYKLYDKTHSYTVFNKNKNALIDNVKRYYSIFLGDLFTYDYNIDNYKRDFSPKDQTVTIPNVENKNIVYKDESKDLFEAKLFTDFLGIAKDKPNGLIQIEVDKRIAFMTTKNQKNYTIKQQYRSANWSFLTYIKPGITISKIESKERKLPLNSIKNFINNSVYKQLYTTTIDLLNYETFSFNTDLNLFVFDFPDAQMTMYINTGFKFGLTLATDSIHTYDAATNTFNVNTNYSVDEYKINSFQTYAKFIMRFFPDKRYGLSFSYLPAYSKILTKHIAQVRNDNQIKTISNTKFASAIQTFEMSAYFQPSQNKNGKIFFRYKFTSQLKDITTNFSQIQLGYAYNFIKK